mgnify:FL=1
MQIEHLLEQLWVQYALQNPSVKKIHSLFEAEGEEIVNDHIAFRTLNDPRISIDVLARPFKSAGYVASGEYHFKTKNLFAKHFELPGRNDMPRIFISELLMEKFSDDLNQVFEQAMDSMSASFFDSELLVLSGSAFDPLSHETYEKLRQESEYAAWFYVHGFRANHFTVSVNGLRHFKSLREVNDFLKRKGFDMNDSGGEIKGDPDQLLEQSSTLADKVKVSFKEGDYQVPACYYEFARRYHDKEGRLFSGFIADSADKIFESTDFRK